MSQVMAQPLAAAASARPSSAFTPPTHPLMRNWVAAVSARLKSLDSRLSWRPCGAVEDARGVSHTQGCAGKRRRRRQHVVEKEHSVNKRQAGRER
jgi:hypothetical protein